MARTPAQTDLDHLLADLALARASSNPYLHALSLHDQLDVLVEAFIDAADRARWTEVKRLGRLSFAHAAAIMVALDEVQPTYVSAKLLELARRPAEIVLERCAEFATRRMRDVVDRALSPATPHIID